MAPTTRRWVDMGRPAMRAPGGGGMAAAAEEGGNIVDVDVGGTWSGG